MKEMSMETRLLLAFLLMAVVFGVTQYLSPPVPPPETPAETVEEPAPQPAPEVPAAPAPEAPVEPVAETDEGAAGVQAGAEQEETLTIETGVHRVVFSNRGAVVKSWVLKNYADRDGAPLELVNQKALALTGDQALPEPFSLTFDNQPPSTDPNGALFLMERNPDGLGVQFRYSDGRVSVEKSFQFTQDSYEFQVSSRVLENGVLIPHSLTWRGGFGDPAVANLTRDARSLYFDEPDSKLNKNSAGDPEDKPPVVSGQFRFAGLEDKYFAAVALPSGGQTLELTTFSDPVPEEAGQEKPPVRVGAAMGGSGANEFPFYVGPKDIDILGAVDARLDRLIDWGWFGIIAKPLFYALAWVAANVTHNFGWAIVVVTVVINTILVPLRMSSMKSSRKMQSIQPLVQEINDKYKDLPMKHPKKADQNQELMALYQKHDINPVGGCLPMILQMPFFYGFYKVLNVAIEMRGADWLWVTDLSQPETLAIRVLPILLVVTQFAQQSLTPTPGADAMQQKLMKYVLPLVFFYMFYFFSAGLVLYWLTSNVVGVVSQLVLNRFSPPPAPPLPVKAAPKKKKK